MRDPLSGALLLVILIEAAAFLAAANRGFDLTDESFYLLTFQHWTEWPSVALFGAYFSPPYKLLGQDVWAMRALGFVLLLSTGIWFSWELGRSLDALMRRSTRHSLAAASLAGGAGVWSYYGAFPVPYTPSYNLLTLTCALSTLALALRMGARIFEGRGRHYTADSFALGFVSSIGIATKFSAGSLVLGLAIAILVAFGWRRIDRRGAVGITLALLAGLVLNVALLLAADPALPTRFQRGIAVTLAMFPRDPAKELATLLITDVPEAFLRSLRILLWPLAVATIALGLSRRTVRSRVLVAVAIGAFVLGAVLDIYVKDNRHSRIALMTLAALWTLFAAQWTRSAASDQHRIRTCIVLAAVLIVPFAYSFGTNNPLLQHMGMAAVFPGAVVVSQVRSMWSQRAIGGSVFALCLMLLAAGPAEIVVRQWIEGRYTYRLGAPLVEQTARLPRNAGLIDLQVDPTLARGAQDFLELVRRSGFTPGQPMIDFTGQSPGLVALAGGVPLGAIWIVGGPMFDADRMARMSLDYVPDSDVRRAWLITSKDSFASVDAWAAILAEKLGSVGHVEAGHVTISDPTSDDKSKLIEVTLWRPQ